jgi:hypothetical protein
VSSIIHVTVSSCALAIIHAIVTSFAAKDIRASHTRFVAPRAHALSKSSACRPVRTRLFAVFKLVHKLIDQANKPIGLLAHVLSIGVQPFQHTLHMPKGIAVEIVPSGS